MLAIARVVWRNIRTTGRTARGIIASATDAERVTSDEHAIFLGITFLSIIAATLAGSAVQRVAQRTAPQAVG